MPQFQWLLFDFDNTLVDFTNTSKNALCQSFRDFDTTCTEAIHEVYKAVNHQVWTAFERGEMSAERLRIERFELLFEAIDLAPASPQIFSKRFLDNLVQLSEAYEGVPGLLQNLGQRYHLGVITNGLKEVQRPRLDVLKLRDHFKSIVVSDEIGVAKPHAAFFDHAYQNLPHPVAKEEILVIGDNLHSDIKGGNDYGCPTCWVSHERDNDTDILPNFTIGRIQELADLLDL